jgi:hypothetical protein
MPDFRHDPGVYVVNGGVAIEHGRPNRVNANLRGIALKQRQPAWDSALVNQGTILATEPFYLKDKGECRVKLADHAGITDTTKGAPVYIIPATHLLTTTASGNERFGSVVEVGPERGLPTGHVRIDMDRRS